MGFERVTTNDQRHQMLSSPGRGQGRRRSRLVGVVASGPVRVRRSARRRTMLVEEVERISTGGPCPPLLHRAARRCRRAVARPASAASRRVEGVKGERARRSAYLDDVALGQDGASRRPRRRLMIGAAGTEELSKSSTRSRCTSWAARRPLGLLRAADSPRRRRRAASTVIVDGKASTPGAPRDRRGRRLPAARRRRGNRGRSRTSRTGRPGRRTRLPVAVATAGESLRPTPRAVPAPAM